MINGIRAILTPYLVISYVSGLRIIEFPAGHSRPWFSLFYMLLIWSIYWLLFRYTIIFQFISKIHSREYRICFSMEIFTTVLSILFGVYYDKKFRNCLKKLDIVDDTLLKLGTTTDYNKLHMRILWLVLGWFTLIIIMNCGTALCLKDKYNYDTVTSIYILFMRNYCFHINAIIDLITASILSYLGLKFDQVNEQLRNLMTHNEHAINRAWENPILDMYQCRSLKLPSNKRLIWIVMHLHLELCKISREINLIFGVEMTFKMGCYFAWLALDLREVFHLILIKNYVEHNKIVFIIINVIWLVHNVWKLFFMNYVCETVSAKARTTGDLINSISYSNSDIEIRENISQLLLHVTQSPLRFCGIGLFEFGTKFLHRFCTSVATVVVLLIQAHTS